ncbi:choline kinase [Trypanosoma grayi]|uniref:choline kinase n=1 Tax=Trypanosoma grayi TaxID=71804 RepID=UPI0004F4AE1C|nr:choline kinase [Trypanosoma grayi]KEG06812.1 choline kinase [Trypanosoma grayi]
MTKTAVEFVQCVIPDDPVRRRAALVDIVLRHCLHILLPNKPSPTTQQNCVRAHVRNGPGAHVANGEAVGADQLCVDRLSGGITNELFHVYHPAHKAHSVVVRVFGKETERVISRESELFYQSIFIPTYVRGINFLVYEFLNLHEALPFTEMPVEQAKIAHELASFQVRATLEARSDHHKPVLSSEERMYWDSVGPTLGGGAAFGVCRFDCEENYTIHALTKWVDQMLSDGILRKMNAERREKYLGTARQLKREAAWMCELLLRHAAELSESVCHNDLLSANIMRHTKSGFLRIIDFDYVKRNYLLFDIANHFNEYTGLECDYDRYFPSDNAMMRFIAVYRQTLRAELQGHRDEASRRQLDDIIPGQERLFMCGAQTESGQYEDDEEQEQRTIEHWVRLVKLLTLASHLSWSIWALLQEAVSTLEVDFFEYARLRLARYLATRDAFSAEFV